MIGDVAWLHTQTHETDTDTGRDNNWFTGLHIKAGRHKPGARKLRQRGSSEVQMPQKLRTEGAFMVQ